MATIHFILQGKGGVGKSFIASTLIQYFMEKQIPVKGIDTDPENATLAGFKELNIKFLDIVSNYVVDTRKFDDLVETVFAESDDTHIIVDNGSSSFIALLGYLKENETIQFLLENEHKVIMHSIIAGGQAIQDTVSGLKSLCLNFPAVPIVVWLNLFFGEVKDPRSEKPFNEFEVYKSFSHQFQGIITIPHFADQSFSQDIKDHLATKKTFDHAIKESSLRLAQKNRIKRYRDNFYTAIDGANLN